MMRAAYYILLFVLLSSFFKVAHAATINPRLEAALQGLTNSDQIDVIVRMRNRVNLKNFDKANRKLKRSAYRAQLFRELETRNNSEHNALKAKLSWLKNKKSKSLWIINGFAQSLSVVQIVELAQNPRVESIDLDEIITLATPVPSALAPTEGNIDMVKAPVLWSYGYTGQGVVVANMDTGVDYNHADLAGTWRGGSNSWYDPYGQYTLPTDTNGHGTHTMGVIVGGTATGSAIGVAPGAQWIAAKIFNDAGTATASAIHASFQWMLNPDNNLATDDAPDVVNNSWGNLASVGRCNPNPPYYDTEYLTDIQTLEQAGIVVIFSAGNSGPADTTGLIPATYGASYAVGAVDSNGVVTSFSSRGPSTCADAVAPNNLFPNVVAPGLNIKLADITSSGLFPTAYTTGSGTSFAAPHVTGAIALLKSAYPTATVTELEAAINNSAFDVDNPGVDTHTGYGLLDIRQALFQLPVDTDGDGTYDGSDTCILNYNPNQLDTDGDGFGNLCDADLNNDNIVNILDFNIFVAAFGSTNPDADLDGNGVVNLLDFNLFVQAFGKAPGPSGPSL